MTIKEALHRELKYGLCRDGALSGLVDPNRVKLDRRDAVSSTASAEEYPWIIFRRITENEHNIIPHARERIEFEIIGLHGSAAKGDTLLEQVKDAIKDHFKGKLKTFGKFTADGTADPTGGLKLKCRYMDTVEDRETSLKEKSQIMVFFFSYIR